MKVGKISTVLGIGIVVVLALLVKTPTGLTAATSALVQNVRVTNTSANPVPVQEVEGRESVQLYAATNSGFFGTFVRMFPDASFERPFIIPVGKNLVITQIHYVGEGFSDVYVRMGVLVQSLDFTRELDISSAGFDFQQGRLQNADQSFPSGLVISDGAAIFPEIGEEHVGSASFLGTCEIWVNGYLRNAQ